MKVLITGGAGFIGKWLVRSLPAEVEVAIVDSLDPQVHQTQAGFAPELRARATCIQADVRDPEAYLDALEGAEVVVHLASQTGTGQSMYEISRYIQHNGDGIARLFDAISSLKQKPKRIILTSSRAVYGEGAYTDGASIHARNSRRLEDLTAGQWEVYDQAGQALKALPMQEDYQTYPTSVYGLTKLWQEQLLENYVQAQGIDHVIFRLQNVYGPEQELHNPYTGIIGIFTSLITQKGEVELFEDGLMTRDFVYVQDVAKVLVQGIFYEGKLARILNVGNGKPTSLIELVETISAAAHRQTKIKYSGRFRVGDIRHAVASMENYIQTFGSWQPQTLEAGIQQYLEWYLQQNPLSETVLASSFKEMQENNLLLQSK